MNDEIKKLKDEERESLSISQEESAFMEPCGANRAWVPGLILVGIGVFFLINNFTNFHLNNRWALFILIPAFGSLSNFLRAYNKDGRFSSEARGSLIGSLILFFITAVFIFGWSWGAMWPVLLIIGGIGALLSGLSG